MSLSVPNVILDQKVVVGVVWNARIVVEHCEHLFSASLAQQSQLLFCCDSLLKDSSVRVSRGRW